MALKTIFPGCGVWSSLMLFFVFHTEIQHGCQKWQEMVFGKKGQMTAYLAGQTFGTVSKISAFLDFMQKLKEAIQKWKKVAGDSRYTLQTTNSVQIVLFYTISKFQDKCIVDFMQKFKKPTKNFCRYSAGVTEEK